MQLSRTSLLFSLFFIFLIFSGCGEKKSAPQLEAHQITQEELGKESICQVCGMKITLSSQTPALDYQGKIYYFCSEEEKTKFVKDPGRFLEGEKEKEKTAPEAEKEIGMSEEEIKASGYEIHKISQEEIDEIVLCPGCRMYLVVSSETPSLRKDENIFYFCSDTCRETFLRKKR